LDEDLDQPEYERLVAWLSSARRTSSPSLARLADALEEYLRDPRTTIYPVKPTPWSRVLAWLEQMGRRISPRVHRTLVIVVLAALAVYAGASTAQLLWAAVQPGPFRVAFESILMARGNLQSITDLGWRLLRLGLEAGVGFVAFAALVSLALRRDDRGTWFGAFAFVASLTTVNLLDFYLDQFGAVLTAVLQFGALMILLSYRHWYLRARSTGMVRT
jgi:hypothetical protein